MLNTHTLSPFLFSTFVVRRLYRSRWSPRALFRGNGRCGEWIYKNAGLDIRWLPNGDILEIIDDITDTTYKYININICQPQLRAQRDPTIYDPHIEHIPAHSDTRNSMTFPSLT